MAYKSAHGVDDLVMLSSLSNDSIVSNLSKRYSNDVIYTYIGHVLISVNPFKQIKNLYHERTLLEYRGKYRYELPPHIYASADAMYRNLLAEGQAQCVIISGESGAGKTEAAKLIMQYISAVSGAGEEVNRVKNIILESNPLLEAFGNAKTLRNNNSSRFGKYLEINFNAGGDPEGGKVSNYLLEKSRVVYQTPGERSFHIFYQLLAGADAKMREELYLQAPTQYKYLSQSGTYTVDGMNDAEEFADVKKAMDVIGIDPNEQMEMFRIVAGILWLGNINFVGDEDHCEVEDRNPVDIFAYLMQVESDVVERSLLFRTISTGTEGRSARVSTYSTPNNQASAYYSRDAMAKALYSRLFDHIVSRVNEALGQKHQQTDLVIGILDIYGFEIFDNNGFEQLCINYVNERLQQIFIDLTLKAEQDEYHDEGVQWENIDYFNNKICCDLIEAKKPVGILTSLDDVCNFPKGDDAKFMDNLGKLFSQHPHFAPATNGFIIKHYAGDVEYKVEGFVDKNKDLLFWDHVELAAQSNSTLLQSLFPEMNMAKDKKRPTTAGFKIRESINALVTALSRCTPHYIRCIKPNDNKRQNDFNNGRVHHQVKYLGLLENVRIRRAGYAYRQVYDRFFYRYRICCKETFPTWKGSFEAGAEAILKSLELDNRSFVKGRTKIFIRQPETVFALEEQRDRKVGTYANKIQRFFMRFTLLAYYFSIQKSAADSLYGNKERRRLSLERPYTGDYVNYRENFGLKDMVNKYGREKLLFSHAIIKYDRRSRPQRRILIITDVAMYVLAIEKNKDKNAAKSKPWVYEEKRRLLVSSIQSLEMSKYSDNVIVIHAQNEHDQLIECRRKTELVGTLIKHKQVSVTYNNNMKVALKDKGKYRDIIFERKPGSSETKVSGSKISSPEGGLPAESRPNLAAPESLPVVHLPVYERKGASPSGTLSKSQTSNSSASSSNNNNKLSNINTNSSRGLPSPNNDSAKTSPNGTISSGSGPSTKPKQQQQQQAKALYDFTPNNFDELQFFEGDILTITSMADPDWFDAELKGLEGKVPANYLELLKPTPSSAPPANPARTLPTPSPSSGRGAPSSEEPTKPTPQVSKVGGRGSPVSSTGRGRGVGVSTTAASSTSAGSTVAGRGATTTTPAPLGRGKLPAKPSEAVSKPSDGTSATVSPGRGRGLPTPPGVGVGSGRGASKGVGVVGLQSRPGPGTATTTTTPTSPAGRGLASGRGRG